MVVSERISEEQNEADVKPDTSIRRLFRRMKIAKNLSEIDKGNGQILRKVIDSTRQAEQSELEPMLDLLESHEFHIDQEFQKLVNELQSKLEKEFPELKNLSIIVVGSAIHPSRLIRNLFSGKWIPSDLDWGISYDLSDMSDDEQRKIREKMIKYVDILLEQLCSKHGFPLIRGCESINPAPNGYDSIDHYVYNFDSTEQAYKYLLDRSGNFKRNDPIFLYFQPSIPSEKNQRNKGYILEALTKLSRENYNLYKRTIAQLLLYWEDLRQISIKHFKNAYINYDLGSRDRKLGWSFYYYGQTKNHFLDKHFVAQILATDSTKREASATLPNYS